VRSVVCCNPEKEFFDQINLRHPIYTFLFLHAEFLSGVIVAESRLYRHAFSAVKARSANNCFAWPLSLANMGIRAHLVLLDRIAFCIAVSSQSLIGLGILFCREDSNVKVTNDVSILQLSGREIWRPRTLS